jgi:hypothetical protein
MYSPEGRNLPLSVGNFVLQSDLDNGPVAGAERSTMRPRETEYVHLDESSLPDDASMWNQVHCLLHIRSLIAKGVNQSEQAEHCFRYLRQSILDNADPTLELSSTQTFDLEAKQVFPGDGEASRSQHIFDWTLSHREDWSMEKTDSKEQGYTEASKLSNSYNPSITLENFQCTTSWYNI